MKNNKDDKPNESKKQTFNTTEILDEVFQEENYSDVNQRNTVLEQGDQSNDIERIKLPRNYKWLIIFLFPVFTWILYAASKENATPNIETTPTPDPNGPITISLEPSLMVPGPMQVPHSVKDGVKGRPDEAIIFRVTMSKPGYVLVALELLDGTLVPLYGGQENPEILSGSVLLSDKDKVIGYPLEIHKGKTITFVAALSSIPWKEILPKHIPSDPFSYPAKNSSDSKILKQDIIKNPMLSKIHSWHRVKLEVLSQLPVYENKK